MDKNQLVREGVLSLIDKAAAQVRAFLKSYPDMRDHARASFAFLTPRAEKEERPKNAPKRPHRWTKAERIKIGKRVSAAYRLKKQRDAARAAARTKPPGRPGRMLTPRRLDVADRRMVPAPRYPRRHDQIAPVPRLDRRTRALAAAYPTTTAPAGRVTESRFPRPKCRHHTNRPPISRNHDEPREWFAVPCRPRDTSSSTSTRA